VERRQREAADTDGRSRLPGLLAQREKARKRIATASTLLIDGVLDREAYDLTRAELSDELTALDREIARVQQQPSRSEVLSLETIMRGMSEWAAALESGGVSAQRDVYGVMLEYVEPVKLGRGRYEARPVWTPLGRQAFWAAAELSGSENLVSIDHSGRTRLSTRTNAPTESPRSLAHSA
ncbi:MAG TPA: hypothetical protein VNG35_08225, partial [Gemmatimonadales bacterium]|nr:hypothetical protein [Gemmatimonadales bacterium]